MKVRNTSLADRCLPEVVRILYGEGVNERPRGKLSQVIGVPMTTLWDWKRTPWRITLEKAIIWVDACNISNDDILAMFGREPDEKGGRNGR